MIDYQRLPWMVLVGADFFGVHPSSTNSTISCCCLCIYIYMHIIIHMCIIPLYPGKLWKITSNSNIGKKKKKHRFEDPRNHHDGYGELVRSVKSHLWHKSSSSHEISWQMTFLVGG